jgi:predicted phosphodiesterase
MSKSILCIGDWGHQPSNEMRLFFLNERLRYNEIFLLGDNFYPSGVKSVNDQQWKETLNFLFPLKVPKYACLGNHDYLGNIRAQFDYTRFSKNNSNWNCEGPFYDRLDWETKTHFIFIDTQILAADITIPLLYGCGASSLAIEQYLTFHRKYYEKQLYWLENILKTSKAKYKIACGHYPLFSNGPHFLSHHLQSLLLPLFKKYKLDIYLSGHDHNSQCIQKDGFLSIVAGGLVTEGYGVRQQSKETLFQENEPGVFLLRYHTQTWNVCHVDLKTKTEKVLYVILKY